MHNQHSRLIDQAVFVVLECVSELMLTKIVLECEGSSRSSFSVSLCLPDVPRPVFQPTATFECQVADGWVEGRSINQWMGRSVVDSCI